LDVPVWSPKADTAVTLRVTARSVDATFMVMNVCVNARTDGWRSFFLRNDRCVWEWTSEPTMVRFTWLWYWDDPKAFLLALLWKNTVCPLSYGLSVCVPMEEKQNMIT
jgi:hypothetical protein